MGAAVGRYSHTLPGFSMDGAGAGAKKEISREATAIESVIQLF